jgi:predicted secreted hydrolase
VRALLALILLIAIATAWWLSSRPTPSPVEPFDLGGVLGGVAEAGFARAQMPREFFFPADHGPHPGFRNEWWYFTGNLESLAGRRFGFQLVFFRNALAPGQAAGDSPWRSHQSWMAHLSLSDLQADGFHAYERFSRGGMGLAGAQAAPFGVWLDDWTVREEQGGWRLQAREQGIALDLLLEPLGKPVLQGEAGLSRKSGEPGNASYYYSIPRLKAEGEVAIEGQGHRVQGLAWLDREWSTSALGEGQVGWDWFSLQLSDGSDLMFYRLRHEDGSSDPFSAGSWLQADGQLIPLKAEDLELAVRETWQSPLGGSYPLAWRLAIPAHSLELEVTPAMQNQELDLLVRYWEGAVDVRGTRAGSSIQGRGYLELTGYAR